MFQDIWIKTRALDDLTQTLRKNSTFDTISPQLLELLFSCEKQSRLQSRAQVSLISSQFPKTISFFRKL